KKAFYHIGSFDYANSIDFVGNAEPNVGVHMYSKGYKTSIKQMKILKGGMSAANTTLNAVSYFDAGIDFYNGNYAEGGVSTFNNLTENILTASRGWGVGLLYSASYAFWEYTLPRSETYNRIMFGKGSVTYKTRSHYWAKSKLLDD